MIPFQFNNEKSIDFIKRVNNISINIDSCIGYDQLRKIDKEELFVTIKAFYKEMVPLLSVDLEKVLSMDAKGKSNSLFGRVHNIKYIFNKEYLLSHSHNDLSAEINLNGTINDYFVLASEYMHLITYYNYKDSNKDLIGIDSSFIRRVLGDYLIKKELITKDEFINIEKLRVNEVYNASKYCFSSLDGSGDKDKFSYYMRIIYWEVIGNEIYELYKYGEDRAIEVFQTYIRSKNYYNNLGSIYNIFDIDYSDIVDDYKKYIDNIKDIPMMEVNYNNKKRIISLKKLRISLLKRGEKKHESKKI